MSDLYVCPRLTIPASELRTSVARSSGPGGQNVNKVNSKVTLRWSLTQSTAIDPGWRNRFVARHQNRINREGELVLHSERYRDQPRNLADARYRLTQMLLECREPAKKRKTTKPTAGSRRRRKEAKQRQSQKKGERRTRWD